MRASLDGRRNAGYDASLFADEHLCDRTDQLRMLGNGVVPLTAAKAWRLLVHRMLTARGGSDA